MCDGLIWSELGATYPEAGGSFAYLNIYGERGAGRPLSFLYAWQLLFSAPKSIFDFPTVQASRLIKEAHPLSATICILGSYPVAIHWLTLNS